MLRNDALTSLVAAVRIPQDEVRFNIALATACTLDPANGAGLARAALRSATEDPAAGKRAEALLAAVPSRLRCSDQVSTNALTLGVGRARGTAGSIDLVLRDLRGFALAVELKIGSRTYDTGQIERYLATGLPVVGLTPKRKEHTPAVAAHDGWLGEALWSDVVDDLLGFSLPNQAGDMWRTLVQVLISDGDFGRDVDNAPPPREDLARRILADVAADLDAPTAPVEWDRSNRFWTLAIPDQDDPAGAVALDLDGPVPFAAVWGTAGGDAETLVRQYGAVLNPDGVVAAVALSLDERQDSGEALPALLLTVVRGFVEAGAIPLDA